jgi:hypothetical protein
MTKEQLELKVKELTAALSQFETDQKELAKQLQEAKVQLADVNKPVISVKFRDQIREAVCEGVRAYRFDEAESYDIDFELNYDNRVEVSNIEFNYTDDLEESICSEIEDLFKIQDNDED